MQLPLIPLDDNILFPGMTATIAADVGDADKVFVVPRRDGEYGRIGTIAEVVETGRLPGGITAVTLTGLHRGIGGIASSGPDGAPADRGRADPRRQPGRRAHSRARARVPRRGRGDPRAARRRRAGRRLPALDLRARRRSPTPRATARTSRSPTSSGCWRRSTSPSGSSWRSSCSASGSPSCRCAAGSATTSSPAPTPSSASTSCASRWSRSARSSARTTPR